MTIVAPLCNAHYDSYSESASKNLSATRSKNNQIQTQSQLLDDDFCPVTGEFLAPENGASSLLGTTAKSTAPPAGENRRNRFKIQALAAKMLAKDARKTISNTASSKALYFGDVHRTCDCAWSVVGESVHVMKSKEHGSGHYKNLATCGSVWACPVCTAKIQERRRQEIAQAMRLQYERGGQCVMITLTAPHYSHQNLSDLRGMQRSALDSFRKRSGAFSRALKSSGYLGLIRSLEVTVSQKNGWHLHTHELWFLDKNADMAALGVRIKEDWEKACVKAGLLDADNAKQVLAFRKHAVDIKVNASCSDYLAKNDDSRHWGADREIAKSSTKQGKKKGFHPFGLLAEIASASDSPSTDIDWCEARFIEYCNGMKGARQLFWSRGLKKMFAVDEKTDEEIACEEVDSLFLVAEIDKATWRKIRASSRTAPLEIV
ncbi:MAG: protein rep, partial [Enterovibrio sp.]